MVYRFSHGWVPDYITSKFENRETAKDILFYRVSDTKGKFDFDSSRGCLCSFVTEIA